MLYIPLDRIKLRTRNQKCAVIRSCFIMFACKLQTTAKMLKVDSSLPHFFTSVIFRQFSMLRVFPNIVLIIHFISSRWGTHASKAAQRTAKTARSAIAFPPKLWSTFGWLWSPCANGVWAMQCRGWGWITKTQIPSMNVVEVYGLGYPSGPWSPDRWCTALLLCKEICPMALATPFC